jgi:SEC-C motif
MSPGRNDPCPCGSGLKYKRCCLERQTQLVRLVRELERLVGEIGELAARRWPEGYERAFWEFYGGGSFGWAGPSAEERLEAELWIVCDRDLAAGESPLDSERRDPGKPTAALEALAASRIRPWCIEAMRSAGLITARCPISGETATLETGRAPAGELAPGRMLVARSVPLGERRFALLGRSPVVVPAVQGDFGDLLAQLAAKGGTDGDGAPPSLRSPDTDRDRLFRLHGGRLSSAAWRWPEERYNTFEGAIATSAIAAWELGDLDAAIEALGREPAFEPTDPDDRDEPEVESWHWIASRGEQPIEPPAELGVRWALCEEDAAAPRRVALIEVDPFDGRLWLHAPSPARLERVEREVRRILGELIGEPFCHDRGSPDSSLRWERERWERSLDQFTLPADRRSSLPRAA